MLQVTTSKAKSWRRGWMFAAAVILLGSACARSHAAPPLYFVSTSGNDSNAGTSQSQAFLTIGKAFDALFSIVGKHVSKHSFLEDLIFHARLSHHFQNRFRHIRGLGSTDHALKGDPRRALLLIYPLASSNVGTTFKGPLVGIGISFPASKDAEAVSYTVNNVYWDQEFGGSA